MSGELYNSGSTASSTGLVYPPPNPMFSGQRKKEAGSGSGVPTPVLNNNNSKELHMFVWSSSASPTSEGNNKHAVNRGGLSELGVLDASKAVLQQEIAAARENASCVGKENVEKEIEIEDGSKNMEEGEKKTQMPPASVMTRLIFIMVWRKLIRNPNTYASLIGLVWSLVSFRWNIQMPSIVKGSISILSDAGLGMAMFSLGLFMALQPKIIACGKSVATFSMAVRFLTGPAVIAATAIAIGLRGVLLHVAIVQAALPQGIVPFVFAKEYNVHPDILSTA